MERDPSRRAVQVVREHHSTAIAAFAAITLPGAGQFYNGQSAKGAMLFLVSAAALTVVIVRIRSLGVVVPVAGAGILSWLIGIVDAGLVSGRIVRGERVTLSRWF